MPKFRNITPRNIITFNCYSSSSIARSNYTKKEMALLLRKLCNDNDSGLYFDCAYPESLGNYTLRSNGNIELEDLPNMEHGIEFGEVHLHGKQIDGGRVVFKFCGEYESGKRRYQAQLLAGCYLENR